MAGLLCIWAAIGSPLASYDDTNVTVHVVQHLLLMMVAPPLLILGRPVVLAMQVAPRRLQARGARTLGTSVVSVLTHPVLAWGLYLGSMGLMLADRAIYRFLSGHALAHDASHVLLLVTGFLYWDPLLGGAASGRRLSHPARLASVLANMPFEVLIGIWLRYQTASLNPAGPLGDTQRAGEAMIVGATLVSTVWLVAVVVQWGRAAIREERRAARRASNLQWSTPWWVEAAEVSGAADGP